MALYYYDPQKIQPAELAKLLGLTFNKEPGPYVHFYADGEPVGYVDRPGVISLVDEIQIPAGVPLKQR
jgi:hypothetical protein